MALMDRLFAARDYVQAQGYAPAYLAIYGSQNYGLALDTPDYRSDVDIKCAVMPDLRTLAFGEMALPATLEWEGGQIEIKDARRFAQVAAKLNPGYLETLMTPYCLAPCETFVRLRQMADGLPAQDPAGFLSACCGAGLKKRKNLCHPFPAAMEKISRYGYDGKQAHHMYRMLLIMRTFERTHRYELAAPQEEIPFLLALKRNEIPLEQAISLTDAWAQEMQAISAGAGKARSVHAQAKAMNEVICEAIGEHVRWTILNEFGQNGR